ncbi:glycosyltransferase family 2 protein [candidate division WOR-3 bacterium]|nr:glycosyltransferase family 2 protein [candidate division WOR-3 bacterium]
MLSIVIVTFNNEDNISECLRSIYEKTNSISYEIIVVDNNSHDKTVKIIKDNYPDVKIIYNHVNENFAYATNQGIKLSKGNYVMLLNPDTSLKNSALEKLYTFLDTRYDVGAAAPKLINDDGTIQQSCREFPTPFNLFTEITGLSLLTHRTSRWKLPNLNYEITQEVDQPSAAALFIRKKLIDEVGGLDLRYPLYMNDIELCYQIKNRGYKIYYMKDGEIYHARGCSTRLDLSKSILYWHFGLIRYLIEHFPRHPVVPFYIIILLCGMFYRTLLYKTKRLFNTSL